MAAINPRFAVVNYGTNDMGLGSTYSSALPGFYENMSALIDQLLAVGVIPVITGLNPREPDHSASTWVPTYNAVTRGLAESRQLPWINLYLANIELPERGLLSDGIHGNVYRTGGRAEPCIFDDTGLSYNYNVRNLLTIEVLDRVRRTVLESAPAPDAQPSPLVGDGSPSAPFLIDALPFTHYASTASSPNRNFDAYPSCDNGQNESGPELLYRLELETETPLRMIVLDRANVDIDLHLLGATGTPDSCRARHDRILETTLGPGSWTLALDTFVSASSGEQPGEYLLVVLQCEPGDPDCD